MPPFNPMFHFASHERVPLPRRVTTHRHGMTRCANRRPGNSSVPIAHDGNAECFKRFEGQRQIENCLGACSHHGHIAFGELRHVSRNIKTPLGAAMHAADAARWRRHGCRPWRQSAWWRRRSWRHPVFRATTKGRSRIETLRDARGRSDANLSISSASRPTFNAPPMIAMVAGMAPPRLIMASTSRAISKLAGYGMPWAMMVDSRATTGLPLASAARTSRCNGKMLTSFLSVQTLPEEPLRLSLGDRVRVIAA